MNDETQLKKDTLNVPIQESTHKKTEEKSSEVPVEKESSSNSIPEYKSTIPYPSRLKKTKINEHYGKFLKIFK